MLNFHNPSFEELAAKEWIVTNGLGGYSSGTLSGANTRRYHGLFVPSIKPPTERNVLVAKIEESISTHRDSYNDLSSNQYPGVIHPKGYQFLESYDRKPLPTFNYALEDLKLQKQVFMIYGSNTVVVSYQNTGPVGFELRLMPLYVNRDYHSLFHQEERFDFYAEHHANSLKIHAHYGSMPLYFGWSAGKFAENRLWFKNIQYEKEEYRGLDFQEDAYSIGFVDNHLEPGESMTLIFSLDAKMLKADPNALLEAEINRLKALAPSNPADDFHSDLAIAADQFLVHRASTDSASIIAGYHWFTDWGRDTMIAMRGICLALDKQEEAKSILSTFLAYLDQGMLPNRFPDSDETPEYNTIDATLWLFVVVYEYHKKFRDAEFIKSIFPKLTEVLEAHFKGTRYNIHAADSGLLFGGEGIEQLTWMDARVGDFVVTPRHGAAVEINALWYNALMIYEELAKELTLKTDIQSVVSETIPKLKKSFKASFYNKEGYLNDYIQADGTIDPAIRPNQVYALSLPFSLLTATQEKSILKVVQEQLYTPLGLRSLSHDHAEFKATYGGDQWHRDTAYHQGTVWAFLLGEFFLAYLKVHKYSKKAKAFVAEELTTIQQHFYESDCIHGISEIFDGLEPSEGRGTVQQAWSIGTLLQVYDALG